MSLEQFTYTASPWGPSAPGWTVFQSSSGVGPKSASALMPYFEFKNPDLGGGDGTESLGKHRLPIRFVYCKRPGDGNRLEDGKRIVAQSLDAGLRWYDKTRGRDYFAHVFVEKGEGDVFSGIKKSFNPMALLLSRTIQTEFPQEYRERALGILNGDYPDEPTPEFPVLRTISDIQTNPEFSDNQLFKKLSDGLVQKIGRIVFAIFRFTSKNGGSTLSFDGTKSAPFDVMAIAVRLLPLVVRRDISFSTWLPSGEARTFPGAERLSFVGTFREGEFADPDTGLYGELPEGGPDFRSREDVELFKRMVDAGGAELKAENFDDLVSCWEVVAGRRTDVASLRKAVQFAERFPGMKDEVVSGLENTCLDPMATVVAWFELNLAAFEGGARQVCDDCVCDGALFAEALRTLDDDAARKAFADAVAEDAEANGTTAELAKMWLGCPQGVRALLLRNVTGPFVSLAALTDRFDALRHDVEDGRVERGRAANLLDEANRVAGRLGDGFEGMEETRNALGYLAALDKLDGVEGIPSFLQTVREFGVDEEKIRSDVLDRVKPDDIPIERLAGNLDAFEGVGIPKEEILRLAVEAAERRGREEGERSGRQIARNAESRAETVVRTRGIPPWIVAAVGAVALAIGLVSGCFFGSFHAPGKAAVTENRELSPLPSALQPQGSDLPMRQPDDSSDLSAQSPQFSLDESLQSPRTFPSQSQQRFSLDLPQMSASGSSQQSPGRQMQESSSTQSVLSGDGAVRSGEQDEWR